MAKPQDKVGFGKRLKQIGMVFSFTAKQDKWFVPLVVAATLILWYEHRLVQPDDLSRLDAAFFNLNAVMAGTVFLFALLDVLL